MALIKVGLQLIQDDVLVSISGSKKDFAIYLNIFTHILMKVNTPWVQCSALRRLRFGIGGHGYEGSKVISMIVVVNISRGQGRERRG